MQNLNLIAIAKLLGSFFMVVLFGPTSIAQDKSGKTLYVPGSKHEWKLSPSALAPLAGPGPTLTFGAVGKTDLHYPINGAYRRRNAPMALFTPSGDFDFSAKVTPECGGLYDGGALLLYSDTLNWAKILLQKSAAGPLIGMSVVEAGITDDAYYPVKDSSSVYFRIGRSGALCSFYTSADGKAWTLTRQFNYATTSKTGVGFYVQSPVGNGCKVIFSHISIQEVKQ